MIKLNQISKSFGENEILKDVSLDIEKGKIFGLIGKNGAGKTTLLSIIAGLTDATKGNCYINDKKISKQKSYDKLGYLPDVPEFFKFMTSQEFIDFLFQKNSGFKAKRDQLLQLVKVNKDTKIKNMSRGMKQRLGIAATLVNDPDILLLDEPSSALDPMGRYELSEILYNLKNQGKTIVISTHILTDLESICDKVGFLHNGFIVKEICQCPNSQMDKIRINFMNPININAIENSSFDVSMENEKTIILSGNIQEIDVQRDILKKLILSTNPIVSINTLGVDLNDIFMEVCR